MYVSSAGGQDSSTSVIPHPVLMPYRHKSYTPSVYMFLPSICPYYSCSLSFFLSIRFICHYPHPTSQIVNPFHLPQHIARESDCCRCGCGCGSFNPPGAGSAFLRFQMRTESGGRCTCYNVAGSVCLSQIQISWSRRRWDFGIDRDRARYVCDC